MSLAYHLIDLFFYGYSILLVVAILLSWFPEYENSSIGRLLQKCTQPYLDLFRRWIPPLGMLDLSPIVAFFALRVVESCLKALVG